MPVGTDFLYQLPAFFICAFIYLIMGILVTQKDSFPSRITHTFYSILEAIWDLSCMCSHQSVQLKNKISNDNTHCIYHPLGPCQS